MITSSLTAFAEAAKNKHVTAMSIRRCTVVIISSLRSGSKKSIVAEQALSQLCHFYSSFPAILSDIDSMTMSAPSSE